MRISSVVAIYTLFWAMSFFLVLPFRLQSRGAEDRVVAGQAESAPPRFSFGRTCAWTTIVAVFLFGLFYLNYIEGWVSADQLNFMPDRLLEGR